MFSLENFYYVLYTNLLKPTNIVGYYFHPFGSTNYHDLVNTTFDIPEGKAHNLNTRIAYFYDQEPLMEDLIKYHPITFGKNITLFANSEWSYYKKQFCKENEFLDWYYFFHGFAALDWFRDYQYIPTVENKFTHVFISLNGLVVKDRSYRLLLGSHLIDRNLLDKGIVSLHIEKNGKMLWKDELTDPECKLSKNSKMFVYNQLKNLKGSLIADVQQAKGSLSAYTGPDEIQLNRSALWHIVSETVFYYPKLHLTEKIFKPIVSKRPFILVGAPGNLAYLKSYGFKTFDRWIDESYDSIEDNDERLRIITDQIEKLCYLPKSRLERMHFEMTEILEYNFNHFYGEFKNIIVKELLGNFQKCAAIWNTSRVDGRNVDLSKINFIEVEKRLMS